jgi:plastocyanin
VGNTLIILFIVLGLGAVAGLIFIFPSFISLTSNWHGSSHGPSETPEEKVTQVVIPAGASSQDSQQIFGPPTVEVVIGSNNKVRWVNMDFAQMSVLADDDRDPGFFNATHLRGSDKPTAGSSLSEGENFEYTFTKSGTYSYHCGFHPWMHGSVIVSSAAQL